MSGEARELSSAEPMRKVQSGNKQSGEKSRSPISNYAQQRHELPNVQRSHGYMKNTMSSGGAPNKLTTEEDEVAIPRDVSDQFSMQQAEDVMSSPD